MDGVGDGSWGSERYFSCKDGHALFIVLSKLKPDSRFVQLPQGPNGKLSMFQCSLIGMSTGQVHSAEGLEGMLVVFH